MATIQKPMTSEEKDELASRIVYTYYITGKICSIQDFADEYLKSIDIAKDMIEQREYAKQNPSSFDYGDAKPFERPIGRKL